MSGNIRIKSAAAMADLQAAMVEVELEANDVDRYVETWVCQKKGFEPSPVCVLKPLAGAMDEVKRAFAAATSDFQSRWGDVRTEVARVTQDFERQEHQIVQTISALRGEEQDIVLPSGKHLRS